VPHRRADNDDPANHNGNNGEGWHAIGVVMIGFRAWFCDSSNRSNRDRNCVAIHVVFSLKCY
jgi:hypothetical protein